MGRRWPSQTTWKENDDGLVGRLWRVLQFCVSGLMTDEPLYRIVNGGIDPLWQYGSTAIGSAGISADTTVPLGFFFWQKLIPETN